jgi:hypothetical protein
MKGVLSFVVAIGMATSVVRAADQDHQTRTPVCLAIDEAHDTLSSQDREAALILVARQFEMAGRQIVSGECGERYALSHVRLGRTITVVLAGPSGQREGRAVGMDDLPALYSQLVRALVTGSSVGSISVVDRTNVTTAQAEPRRVGIDSFGYARLGYGQVLGKGGAANPTIGFGYRAELDSFGLDVSFLNQQLPSSNGAFGASNGFAGSLLKLTALYFTSPQANASAYLGGGISWGATSGPGGSSRDSYSSWNGSGLQGELTAGYELPRASELRVFVQADVALPFYHTVGQTVTYSPGRTSTTATGRRYNPSATVSVGLGWHRRRR